MGKSEEIREDTGCGRFVEGICEMGYQSCALTMYHPNCKNRVTEQPDRILSKQQKIREWMARKTHGVAKLLEVTR